MTARRLALAAISFLVLALPGSAQATFPGANGKIAFVRSGDIWTMSPDGSNQVDITNTLSAGEDAPAWSADGTQITYVRDRAIWTMHADGTLQTQVVPAPTTNGCGFPDDALGGPAWSPSGSKIAFHTFTCTRDVDGGELPSSDLYTVNPDGTGQTLLVTEGRDPRWSPDGTKIGYTFFCFGGGCGDLRWITPDGSSGFVIYQDSFFDDDTLVDWSPDGLLVDGGGERHCPPCSEAYTIHPDGTGYTVLPNGVGTWSPDGTKFVQPGVYTMNVDGSNRTQIASSGTSPDWQPITTNYVRPRGASPLRVSLVPAYRPCTASNRTHGSPLSFPSCNPPQQQSGSLTIGSPDANGQGAKSTPYVRFGVKASAPADVRIKISIGDVRNKADLTDYAGELREQAFVRTTDRNNGTPSPGGTDPATMVDVPFPVNVPCAATADTTIGGECNVETTENAIIPGAVTGGDRAVWELSQVQVFDGGPDGAVATEPNTLFMDEGIFIP